MTEKSYCVSCKEYTESIDPIELTTKDNRPYIKSKCKACNSNKTSFRLMGGRTAPKQVRNKKSFLKEINKLKEEKEEIQGTFRVNGKGPIKSVNRINRINKRLAKLLTQLQKLEGTEN